MRKIETMKSKPNLMSQNNAIIEEVGNTLGLVSSIQSDLSKQRVKDSPELRETLLRLQELVARLEEAVATRQ